MVETAVYYIFLEFKQMCLSAGLYPGTEYLISVQAIKGTTEGKSSSVTGATGQCQHIQDPFNVIWLCVTVL